jgi:DNA polymerase
MKLPSGRRIAYQQPEIGENRFGDKSLVYIGVNQTTRQWTQLETYGGKIVENAVQAIARDCLAVAMARLDAAGYKIVMHIHDEMVADMPEGTGSLKEVEEIMSRPIDWAPGLILAAEGWEDRYFKKD